MALSQEAQLERIWREEVLLLAPGSGADNPFSLPTSLNTGNSGAAGSLGQAGNFPTAGGGWECATLQRRGRPASVLTLGEASVTVNVCVRVGGTGLRSSGAPNT